MVSAMTAIMAFVLGMMTYVMVPVTANAAPVSVRARVGTFYLKLGSKVYKQFTFVRRVLSGYDILPIHVDNEQKLLKTTLSGSMLGDDEEYRFGDPDNRISRLFNKVVGINYELVPAALDAELAEWGYWVGEKETGEGLRRHATDDDRETLVDPYVEAGDGLRLVDPVDAFNLVTNDVDSENIKTAEKITQKRYEKYDSGLSIADSMRMLLGYGAGVVGVIVLNYAHSNLIDGGVPGGEVVGNETLALVPWGAFLDAMVVVV